MVSERKYSTIRIYADDTKRLWDLINAKHRTLADVISYLLNAEGSDEPT